MKQLSADLLLTKNHQSVHLRVEPDRACDTKWHPQLMVHASHYDIMVSFSLYTRMFSGPLSLSLRITLFTFLFIDLEAAYRWSFPFLHKFACPE